MSKKIQLQIPTPCHENWDKMTAAEKGRFCDSCKKTVIDFSNMSDREIAFFFKKPSTHSICGRFMEDQLNRGIQIPKKRIPWLKYFFQFALPAFLISMKTSAQKPVKKIITEMCAPTMGDTIVKWMPNEKNNISLPLLQSSQDNRKEIIMDKLPGSVTISTQTIKGKIIDEEGNPVPFATVVIKGTKNGVATDKDGIFSMEVEPKSAGVTIVATSVGFTAKEFQIQKEDFQSNAIILVTLQPLLQGEVVVVVGMIQRKTQAIPLISEFRKDTASKNFKIYPNPIQSNSTLNIEWSQKVVGDNVIQLFNQSGQLVFTKELNIVQKERSTRLGIPSLIPGNYFLKIANKTTGQTYTEKLIIE
jgi:hypothetical protein